MFITVTVSQGSWPIIAITGDIVGFDNSVSGEDYEHKSN